MNNRAYRSGVLLLSLILLCLFQNKVQAQRSGTNWAKDGYQYYRPGKDGIEELDTRDSSKKTVILTKKMLTPAGKAPLSVSGFSISDDGNKALIFTNTKRVWRYNTKG